MMNYRGYCGRVEYDEEARIFFGEVEGLKAVITFHGTTMDEANRAFRDSVDDYIEWCKARGKPEEVH